MTIFWPRGIHSRWRLELCIIRLHSKWMISRDYPYAAAWFSIDSLCSAICSADETELGLSSCNKIDSHKLVGHFQIPKSPITSFIDSSCEDSTNGILFVLFASVAPALREMHVGCLEINILFAVILDYNYCVHNKIRKSMSRFIISRKPTALCKTT